MTKRKIEYWVIPPEADAEFVADMEEVLETYATALTIPRYPVLCMDEQPVQLLKETRVPIPATKDIRDGSITSTSGRARPASSCSAEPLSGWRQRTVRERRDQGRLGHGGGPFAGTRYAGGQKVILVCDNLNTHTKGAFYEAFAAGRGAELACVDLEFRHTPKHGSWLNVAESELSCTDEPMPAGPAVRRLRPTASGNRRLVSNAPTTSNEASIGNSASTTHAQN